MTSVHWQAKAYPTTENTRGSVGHALACRLAVA